MILREGNWMVHFYDKHHQNWSFTVSKTVVSRILWGQRLLSYGGFFDGVRYKASFLAFAD